MRYVFEILNIHPWLFVLADRQPCFPWCCSPVSVWRDDAGAVHPTGPERPAGAAVPEPGTAAQPQVQTALRLPGPPAVLRLHTNEGTAVKLKKYRGKE